MSHFFMRFFLVVRSNFPGRSFIVLDPQTMDRNTAEISNAMDITTQYSPVDGYDGDDKESDSWTFCTVVGYQHIATFVSWNKLSAHCQWHTDTKHILAIFFFRQLHTNWLRNIALNEWMQNKNRITSVCGVTPLHSRKREVLSAHVSTHTVIHKQIRRVRWEKGSRAFTVQSAKSDEQQQQQSLPQ